MKQDIIKKTYEEINQKIAGLRRIKAHYQETYKDDRQFRAIQKVQTAIDQLNDVLDIEAEIQGSGDNPLFQIFIKDKDEPTKRVAVANGFEEADKMVEELREKYPTDYTINYYRLD